MSAYAMLDVVFSIATFVLISQNQWIAAGFCWVLAELASVRKNQEKISMKIDVVTGLVVGQAREIAKEREERSAR